MDVLRHNLEPVIENLNQLYQLIVMKLTRS